MIIIQHVKTSWTKEYRAAPKAKIRNQVPRKYLIKGLPESLDEILAI